MTLGYGGACLCGLALVAPRGAHAQFFQQNQVIDQYLDPTVYGTDIQPGVTVPSRLHPDFDPVGVHIGQFVVLPVLRESFGFDDNVTGTQASRGSALLQTDAKVSALAKMSDGSINIQGNVTNYEYLSLSRESYTPWNAAITGQHQFGQDLLTLTASHYTQYQTPRDLNVPQLDAPIAYRFENVKALYSLALGRWQIQPSMDFSYYTFDNGRVGGTTLLQSYRDRLVYYPSITTKYEFATRRSVVLIVRDAVASYTTSVANLPSQNFNDISVLAGLSYDLDGVIGLRFLGGYEERNFSSRAYKKIDEPILEGAMVWTPTELTTVTATAARFITDTSAEGTIGETQTTLKLGLDHELFRNVVLSGKVGFGSAQYIGSHAQQIYSAELNATWKINRLLRLGVDYLFTDRQGTNVAPVIVSPIFGYGQSYSENVIKLELSAAF